MTTPRPRPSYIGSIDVAKLAGVSRYGGPFDVYLAKVEGQEIPMNAPMEWGLRLERAVAQAWADRTGHVLEQGVATFDPALPFLGGTPDFLAADDPNLGMDSKTSTEEALRLTDEDGQPLWGPEGTDQVPMDYLVQGQWLMGLTGRRRWDIAAFFLGPKREFRIYNLEFDPDLFESLKAQAVAFWRDHVEAQVPPPIDLVPSDVVRAHLLTRAQAGKKAVDAPPGLAAVALELEEVSRRRGELEDQEDAIKGRLAEGLAEIGAQKIQGLVGGKKWSVAVEGGGEGKPVTDWRGVALQLAKRAGLAVIPAELEADFTRPGPPRKPFIKGYFTALRKGAAPVETLKSA